MWRALVFIGLLCVAAFGAVWLADRPGGVLITWGGYRVETTVAAAAVMAVALRRIGELKESAFLAERLRVEDSYLAQAEALRVAFQRGDGNDEHGGARN